MTLRRRVVHATSVADTAQNNEAVVAETNSVRIYGETLLLLRRVQGLAMVAGQDQPTYADLIGRAVKHFYPEAAQV